jgi:hypothetical protein
MRTQLLMVFVVLGVAQRCNAEDHLPSEKYQGIVCALCENPLTIRGGKLYAMGNHKLLVDSADPAERHADVPAEVLAETVLVENLVITEQVIGLDFLDLRTKQRRIGYIAIDSDGDVRMVADPKDAAKFQITPNKDNAEEQDDTVDVTRFTCEWLEQGKPSGRYLAARENNTVIAAGKRDLRAQKFVLGDLKEATPLVTYRYRGQK